MEGIQFLVNEQGKKTSVLIDLEQWGELWEDFQDCIVSQSREDEEEVNWNEIKTELSLSD